ncbi:hypothetical protein ACSBL2_12505 [Pedobacter sp. AW31-3R]|uniref:hypothetical protein n=1 Tax=Pedobacter sp. AW31-3R TaxID=3445781 RepID=UPI003FA07638
MKKLTDTQIQELLERNLGLSGNHIADLDKEQIGSYHSLFRKLNEEPEEGLPFDFSSKVSRQVQLKVLRRSNRRFNLLAAAGIIIGLALAYGLLTLVDFDAGNSVLLVILKFKWQLIFGYCMFIGSLLFDQRFAEKH